MITGIGTDIVEVNRISKAIERWGDQFLKHVYTGEEIAYCLRFKYPAEHFAGRFAAKEAVIKALPDLKNLTWTGIEILNDNTGKPHCILKNKNNDQPVLISISHTHEHAIAFAIIAA